MGTESGLRSLLKTVELNNGNADKVLKALLRGNQDLVVKHLNLPDPDPPPGSYKL